MNNKTHKIKSFRDHLLECKDNGTRFTVEFFEVVSNVGCFVTETKDHSVLVCGKYKCQCKSSVCLKERTSKRKGEPK